MQAYVVWAAGGKLADQNAILKGHFNMQRHVEVVRICDGSIEGYLVHANLK